MISLMTKKLTEEEKRQIEVKEKLQQYVKECNSTKCKWLLSSHSHCFIDLS